MTRLSVILITQDESTDIRACLESVHWADEIVVVDGGSRDDTIAICREYTDKVYVSEDWPGFGPQKNHALSYATGEWVLSLDADERVSSALRHEIEQAMAAGHFDAYEIPRLSTYCGRTLRHGGWWPDHVLRLFKRGQGSFSNRRVHEKVIVTGPYGQLQEPLIHETFASLEEVIDKINRYSSEGARLLHEQGKRGGLGTAIGHSLWAFIRTYFLKAGLLDGREGLMLAISNAEGTYYRYLKLAYLLKRQADRPQVTPSKP
jgi:glycosyltransferase involved in cell wall biosynthesis